MGTDIVNHFCISYRTFVGVTYTANDMKKIYKDYDVKVEHHNMSADYNYCPVCGTKLKETMDD